MPNSTALEKKIHKLLNTHGGKNHYLSDHLYLSDEELNNATRTQKKFAVLIEKMIRAKASDAAHDGLQLLVQAVPNTVLKRKANDYMDGVQYAYTVLPNTAVKLSDGSGKVLRLTKVQVWVWYSCEPKIDID